MRANFLEAITVEMRDGRTAHQSHRKLSIGEDSLDYVLDSFLALESESINVRTSDHHGVRTFRRIGQPKVDQYVLSAD